MVASRLETQHDGPLRARIPTPQASGRATHYQGLSMSFLMTKTMSTTMKARPM